MHLVTCGVGLSPHPRPEASPIWEARKAAARRGERAITARVDDFSTFETPSRGSSTASAVLSSICLCVVCLSAY